MRELSAELNGNLPEIRFERGHDSSTLTVQNDAKKWNWSNNGEINIGQRDR